MKKQNEHPQPGDLIRMYRENAKLTQEQLAYLLAQRIGEWNASGYLAISRQVTRTTVTKWETSERSFDQRDAKVIAAVLAEALQAKGKPGDEKDIYQRLIFSLQPQITTGMVSWQAALLDAMMQQIPDDERAEKWKILYRWVQNEIDYRLEEEHGRYVTKLRHKSDNTLNDVTDFGE